MSQDLNILSPEEFVDEIVWIVCTAERAMPAYFTSNGDRKQSFCVDYDDIEEKDEYRMAAQAYNGIFNHIKPEDNITYDQTIMIMICGEDLMIASYIVEKRGRSYLMAEIGKEIITRDIRSWPKEFNASEIFKSKPALKWFEYCMDYGTQVAQDNSAPK